MEVIGDDGDVDGQLMTVVIGAGGDDVSCWHYTSPSVGLPLGKARSTIFAAVLYGRDYNLPQRGVTSIVLGFQGNSSKYLIGLQVSCALCSGPCALFSVDTRRRQSRHSGSSRHVIYSKLWFKNPPRVSLVGHLQRRYCKRHCDR